MISRIASLVRRVGGGLGNGLKFVLFRFWRGKDQDLEFFGLFWRTIRIFFWNCWGNISPSVKVLKKDLVKLAKMSFASFRLFIEKMLRKGVFFLMESLKRLWKNDRFFNQISYYLAVALVIWAVFSILKWVVKRILKKKEKK